MEKKSIRLRQFEDKLRVLEKSKVYLEKELEKIIGRKKVLMKKIHKEKEAIALSERAKRLRH